MKKLNKKLLIFDFDGTLVDSKRDIAIAVNHTLASFAIPPLDEETIAGYVGSGIAELMKGAMKAGGDMCISPSLLEKARDIFKEFYDVHCVDNTGWYPHVFETLRELSKKYLLTILTNKPQNLTDKIIEKLGGASLFKQVLGTHNGFEKKPDPAGALHLMEQAGVGPKETLLIGDSIVDAQTTTNAGIDLGLVTYGFGKDAELKDAKPLFRISDFSFIMHYLPVVSLF